jgi:cellulose synthase/poly-beta-1,6-N-acetylglucosamine synthase-like glycosyltransferase
MSSIINKNPMISIIIPCRKIDNYTRECIEYCKKLDYDNYEIIVLPDNSNENIEGVNIIPTGNVTPGKKRNLGIKNAKGEILAFIDSDAKPERGWLRNAILYFKDPEIVAIGGPGITPAEDSLMQKASGYILSSFMVGGLSSRYKNSGRAKESDDIHSCNFIIRKSIVEKIGWNEKYWPGEDTLICLEIKKLGKKIIQAPNIIVYHHRKPLFMAHLKQISGFGLHRGFFAKKYPKNSLKLTYFFPSFLLLFLFLGGIISYFSSAFRTIYFSLILVYLILTFINATFAKDIKLFLPVWIGTILTHLTYGVYFLVGLAKRELER